MSLSIKSQSISIKTFPIHFSSTKADRKKTYLTPLSKSFTYRPNTLLSQTAQRVFASNSLLKPTPLLSASLSASSLQIKKKLLSKFSESFSNKTPHIIILQSSADLDEDCAITPKVEEEIMEVIPDENFGSIESGDCRNAQNQIPKEIMGPQSSLPSSTPSTTSYTTSQLDNAAPLMKLPTRKLKNISKASIPDLYVEPKLSIAVINKIADTMYSLRKKDDMIDKILAGNSIT